MKTGLLVLNGVLLVLVGVLFYLHFSSKQSITKVEGVTKDNTAKDTDFQIAYFEMDSLETSFSMVKDVKSELSRKEEAINTELSKLEKNYRNKINQYQAQGASMTQVQSEMAQRDVMQMQQTMQGRKQALDQEYQDLYMRKMKDVKSKIEDYLKQYNNQRGYNYILAYEPGLFYYRDTAFNITKDLIKGLNEQYSSKK